MIITSFFAQSGTAKIGLNPTIRVWHVLPASNTLVVVDAPVAEVGDGFYKYEFILYDPASDYVVQVDAGVGMTSFGRYSVTQIAPTGSVVIDAGAVNQIINGVWDEPAINHVISGSTGEVLSTIKADTTAIAISIPAINTILQRLLKYDNNRTRVDASAKTLTVFDDDGVTPIQVFNLKDSSGVASVAEVAERVPTL
jgi:hypothetical protein